MAERNTGPRDGDGAAGRGVARACPFHPPWPQRRSHGALGVSRAPPRVNFRKPQHEPKWLVKTNMGRRIFSRAGGAARGGQGLGLPFSALPERPSEFLSAASPGTAPCRPPPPSCAVADDDAPLPTVGSRVKAALRSALWPRFLQTPSQLARIRIFVVFSVMCEPASYIAFG